MLALALFVLDAIGPALAALAGAPQKSHFVEICSRDGMKRVVAADLAGDPGSNETGFRCPMCVLHAGHAAIDAPRIDAFRLEAPFAERPAARLHPRKPQQTLPLPPPRGPPRHS
ncbi:MAG: DUF2946 family protein [Betaproteobacteria bacterium]|nr:DUF2946 family protein [Betaproteobacteria bacterium]